MRKEPSHPGIDHRLQSLSIGLGATATAAAATAASVSLPQKAEAIVPMVSGIQLNDTVLIITDVDTMERINIQFDPYNFSNPIRLGSYIDYGWNVRFDLLSPTSLSLPGTFFLKGYTTGAGTVFYNFLNTFYTATATVNLAGISSGSWSNSLLFNGSPGDTFYIGLRRSTSAGSPTYFGWSQVQAGSTTHLQTAINFDNNGAITIGQVPEPSSALLLATGASGLLATRRRKNRFRGAA